MRPLYYVSIWQDRNVSLLALDEVAIPAFWGIHSCLPSRSSVRWLRLQHSRCPQRRTGAPDRCHPSSTLRHFATARLNPFYISERGDKTNLCQEDTLSSSSFISLREHKSLCVIIGLYACVLMIIMHHCFACRLPKSSISNTIAPTSGYRLYVWKRDKPHRIELYSITN